MAVLRSALLHQTAYVPLVQVPRVAGQHLLEVDVDGEILTLLADPAGPETAAGFPLAVRSVTRPQMAQIFGIVERLDVPTVDLPPSSGGAPRSDRTVMHAVVFSQSDLPPSPISSGVSYVPAPLDDYQDSVAMIAIAPGWRTPPPPSRVEDSLPVGGFMRTEDPSLFIEEVDDDAEPVSQITGVPEDPRIGRMLAKKYRLDSLLGTGATAAVYRAMHIDLGRLVAVKVLHQQHANDAQFVQRFRGEARAASRLEHPNVARVLDFGHEEDGLLYLVMELLVGRSLEAVLAASVKLPPRGATDLVIQAANGIASAHDIGIIHRDVKPENLILVSQRDDDGNPKDLVKVCDFGLAKLRDRDPEQDEDLTTVGMLMGSPAYMSPEQTRGETLDVRTDIYSLGVTLYECLTGAMPHDANTLEELFRKKMLEAPRPITSRIPDIDPGLAACVNSALATDPKKRPQTMRAFRDALRKVLLSMPLDSE